MKELSTQCCIVGGGPAGMMLGLLLARAGVRVIVLEKHDDFFRDFRGDTIHPSTLEVMRELGLLDDFLKLPHDKLSVLKLIFEGQSLNGPSFEHLPVACRYIAFMPQWDFLNFIAERSKRYPSFELIMGCAATGVVEHDGRVSGVRALHHGEEMLIRADLVCAADGRHSTVRAAAGLAVREFGVPIDVLWYRMRKTSAPYEHALGRLSKSQFLVTLDRGDYFQCATIIPKGDFPAVQQRGLEMFRRDILSVAPFLSESVDELQSWDDVKLLTVQVNRLPQWSKPGLLCIGDAAHAMSPMGGVGINLAIQDSVAAANLLAVPLRNGAVTAADLLAVQRRRELPVRVTQAIQVQVHRQMFKGGKRSSPIPAIALTGWGQALIRMFAPLLRRFGARVVGLGVRPEHVRSPAEPIHTVGSSTGQSSDGAGLGGESSLTGESWMRE